MKNIDNEEKKIIAYPIRMNESLLAQIDVAAEKLDTSKQDTIRFLIRIGLEHLEAIKYKVPQAVLEKSGITTKKK